MAAAKKPLSAFAPSVDNVKSRKDPMRDVSSLKETLEEQGGMHDALVVRPILEEEQELYPEGIEYVILSGTGRYRVLCLQAKEQQKKLKKVFLEEGIDFVIRDLDRKTGNDFMFSANLTKGYDLADWMEIIAYYRDPKNFDPPLGYAQIAERVGGEDAGVNKDFIRIRVLLREKIHRKIRCRILIHELPISIVRQLHRLPKEKQLAALEESQKDSQITSESIQDLVNGGKRHPQTAVETNKEALKEFIVTDDTSDE